MSKLYYKKYLEGNYNGFTLKHQNFSNKFKKVKQIEKIPELKIRYKQNSKSLTIRGINFIGHDK